MSIFTPEQEAFLREQKWAVLATGRLDGSPQVSTIGYDWNGVDLVCSVKSFTAKWKNALRQPRVALVVNEGHKQLVIYGRADGIDQDPERTELTQRVMQRLSGKEVPKSEGLMKGLDEQKRTVLRITPEKATMND